MVLHGFSQARECGAEAHIVSIALLHAHITRVYLLLTISLEKRPQNNGVRMETLCAFSH